MFIKTTVKIDKKSGKRYEYYSLCESYRLNGKPRRRTIISGALKKTESIKKSKLLVNRTEEVLIGSDQIICQSAQRLSGDIC